MHFFVILRSIADAMTLFLFLIIMKNLLHYDSFKIESKILTGIILF